MAKKLKEYFDQTHIDDLSASIRKVSDAFNSRSFKLNAKKDLEEYELKDRIRRIAAALHNSMDGSYEEKIRVLSRILGPENPGSFGSFNDYFWQWTLSSVVEQFGLEHRETSMDFIYELTKRSTGEFAIRPFLIQDPEYVFSIMRKWSKDKNFHVRRLSTEGLRPILPWAKKCTYFVDKPAAMFRHLNSLKSDKERYVVNSVANHMGDMLKLNYEFSMLELEKWSSTANETTKWLIRHAVRNLRKKEDRRAIELTRKMKY